MTRIAGIIVNLVPYHHARWEAFTRSSGTECHLLELTDRDAFKVLEFSASASYRRHTLFPCEGGKTISATALRRAMAAKLDVLRPEVVCVSGWSLPVSLAALEWSARNRVPVVMLSESNEFDEARSAVKEFVKRRIVALCSAGLAGGTPQAEYLSKLGLPRERIFLGYDAVDNDYFKQNAEKLKAESTSSGLRPPSPQSGEGSLPEKYFLACARFGRKKNLPGLIEAYARYREIAEKLKSGSISPRPSPQSGEGDVPWDLVIVGDGEQRGEIEKAIARFGVAESTHLVGAKSYAEMPFLYGLASAFVHASTTEQWGLVVNEAMASGLPVLVSNRCGCAHDLVQDGVNGFTFDPCNVEQLAQLMLKLSLAREGACPVESDLLFQQEATSLGRLSAFGDASREIIANWGPERFANGLKQAVECALKAGPVKPSLLQRLLLKALLSR